VAALCGTIVLAGWMSPGLLASVRRHREHRRSANRGTPAPRHLSPAKPSSRRAAGNRNGQCAVANTDVATAAESRREMATGKMVASYEPESIVEAALPDPSQMPADLPPVQVATIRQNRWTWATMMSPNRCRQRAMPPTGAGDAGFSVSHLLRLVRTAAAEKRRYRLKVTQGPRFGTPVEEIKRASDAFGLDFSFMKAVARMSPVSTPSNTPGRISPVPLSKYEFNKFGSGQILDSATMPLRQPTRSLPKASCSSG